MPRPNPDTLGMFGLAEALPRHLSDAAAHARSADLSGLPTSSDISNIVVLGMGGSGISGDVVKAVVGSELRVPYVQSKGYECPAFVNDASLVIAVSFSGNTEETLAATAQANRRGAQIVCVSSGGTLAQRAEEWNAPHVALLDGIPMPRAGLAAIVAPLLVVLERVGLVGDQSDAIMAAASQLTKRITALSQVDSEAEKLARKIGRTFPLVYGGDDLGATAAMRWKAQFNENTKIPSFSNTIPELCHNELAGWGQHGDVTRQVLTLVNLRHDFEHERTSLRFPLMIDQVDEVVGSVHEVRAEGTGRLAQLFDLVAFGDFVSLYLAGAEGVDPGPIPALELLKERMSRR